MLKKLDIGTSEIEQVEAFNALVDTVNKQDKAIRLLINGLECFAKGQQLMNTEIEIKV